MDAYQNTEDMPSLNKDYLQNGLTGNEVKSRIQDGKINGNESIRTKSIKRIFFDNVCTLFNLINLLLALCIFYVHSYKNMLFMFVVFWNIFIGVFQEIRSKRIIDRLSLLSAPNAVVIRDGKKKTIDLSEIVLNDLMVLTNGNQVCADCQVTEGSCEVNESFLSGENEPITKKVGDTLYSGSFLVSGQANAMVTHIGKDNYVNRITGKAKYVKKINSEMLLSIKKIIKIISICLIPVTALLFYNQITMPGNTFEYSVVSTVAAVIGMIPSGLVLLISMVLAVSSIKLAGKNTLVQELFCIENLSKVDVLCLDKTGTLTEGTMHLENIVPLCENDFTAYTLKTILYRFTHSLEDSNATFLAIKEYCKEIFKDKKPSPWEIRSYLAFSSARKWSMVDFETKGCFVMGAGEFIFDSSNFSETSENSAEIPSTDSALEKLKKTTAAFSEKGIRVLVVAHSKKHCEQEQLPKDLTPIALILLSEKLRADACETLAYFKKQGVDLKIISGDNPATAAYIAKKAGFEHSDRYIDASTLKTDEELSEACEYYSIFGRVTPDQKLSLVKSLQSCGHTVAMTGDGVNDVLALKEADCSIAMQSGSDAARNVAQIVLLDSKFSSMPEIVATGRQTINNIQRSASLYLTKTIYSTILAFIFVFLNRPYPFVPIQTTLTGALTIGIPSFILALEPNHNRIHGKFLANILRLAIPGGLLVVFGVISAEIFGMLFSLPPERVSTLAAYALFIASATELFKVCLPFNNLRISLFASLTGIFFIAATVFRGFFGFTPLRGNNLLYVAILIPSCILLFSCFDLLTERILGSPPNVYRVHPCYSFERNHERLSLTKHQGRRQTASTEHRGRRALLVLDEVEKKDYADTALLMKNNKMLRAKKVFFLYSPKRGGDVAVDSDDETFDLYSLGFAACYFHKKMNGRQSKILVECPYYEKPIEVELKKNCTLAVFDLPENDFYSDFPKAGHYEKRVTIFKKRKITL